MAEVKNLRGGLIGCGYFAQNHLYGWRDVKGAEIVALCDLDPTRLTAASKTFGIAPRYTDLALMLKAERLDFLDVVTQAPAHRPIVEQAAAAGVHTICQKPFAPTMQDARAMVVACNRRNVRLMVHENFRWQRPLRMMKEAAAGIGELFYGRIVFRNKHDVFSNQPYLATDERFIIYGLGIHLLDLARFYLGDVSRLSCHTQSRNPRVRGEDVAAILLQMESGASCVVEASYFSDLERDLFPQTLIHLEGTEGSASLGPDHSLTVVSGGVASNHVAAPRRPEWASGRGAAIQESVVAIQQHWTDCLHDGLMPETHGLDNLKTLELVFGAYESADSKGIFTTERAMGG